MTEYDAVVYDLDGTLVRLDVDWAEVAERCGAALGARGVEADGMDLWEMRDAAADRGVLDRIDEVIAEFEREGARSACRLPLADELPRTVPVGVCSLNAEAACRIALELHGLDRHVDAVIGRDSVEGVKPDSEPLLRAVELLGADPSDALFVGDSDADAEAADGAGIAFEWVADRR